MNRVNYYPYDFFVLMYLDGEFQCVLITSGTFTSLSVAKEYALAAFCFSETDVLVVMDHRSVLHYYHGKYKTWYKNLKDAQLRVYFSWLVDSQGVQDER